MHVLSTPMHLIRPCIFAQSMIYARVAIDVLAPMCWHVISGACVLGHAVARSSTDMRACANACARVPMRVLGPMSWHASNARTHAADVLADSCDGDVALRSRKRSRRLPHAHVCQVVSHITSDMPRASQPEALTARSTSRDAPEQAIRSTSSQEQRQQQQQPKALETHSQELASAS